MADLPGFGRQGGSLLGVARADHAPAVDEDLGANLLGDDQPVERN